MYVHVTHICQCGTSLKAPMYPCMIQLKSRMLPGLRREGSTINEILKDLCLTLSFCIFLFSPTLWIYGGASKGQDCKPGRQADAAPGTLDDSFGEEAPERGLWASPCGDVDQGASGREVCSSSLGSLWSGRVSPRLEADSHRIYYWLNCTYTLLA